MAEEEYIPITITIKKEDKIWLDSTGRSPSKYLRQKIKEDRIISGEDI